MPRRRSSNCREPKPRRGMKARPTARPRPEPSLARNRTSFPTAEEYVSKADQLQDWSGPGAPEVTPGVFRIPLPLPNNALRAVNVYAVRDGDQLVMIDGGWALEESEAKLASSLEGIGHGLGDISQFLVTHVHRDHYTQAVAVRRRFGTRVSLGEGERASLEALKPKNAPFEMPQLAVLRAAGADELVRALRGAPHEGRDSANWTGPDQWLPDGARISLDKRDLDAIRTPGHTQGHLVFHDASAHLLFSGDHVRIASRSRL